RIVGIIFVTLHVGLYKLGTDALDRVAELGQLTGPVMGAAKGFQPNQAGGQSGDKRQDLVPHESLFEDDLAVRVHAVELKEILGPMDPRRRTLWIGGPPYD